MQCTGSHIHQNYGKTAYIEVRIGLRNSFKDVHDFAVVIQFFFLKENQKYW